MRPYVVGGVCHRVQQQLDQAMSLGQLDLSSELTIHAERCTPCGAHLREVEDLFRRLRSAPVSLDLGPVPGVVDSVLYRIAAEGRPALDRSIQEAEEKARAKRRVHLRWVLGQVAIAAAVFGLAVGGFTYLALRVNHAAGGAMPSEVVSRWVAPLENWTHALFRSTK